MNRQDRAILLNNREDPVLRYISLQGSPDPRIARLATRATRACRDEGPERDDRIAAWDTLRALRLALESWDVPDRDAAAAEAAARLLGAPYPAGLVERLDGLPYVPLDLTEDDVNAGRVGYGDLGSFLGRCEDGGVFLAHFTGKEDEHGQALYRGWTVVRASPRPAQFDAWVAQARRDAEEGVANLLHGLERELGRDLGRQVYEAAFPPRSVGHDR